MRLIWSGYFWRERPWNEVTLLTPPQLYRHQVKTENIPPVASLGSSSEMETVQWSVSSLVFRSQTNFQQFQQNGKNQPPKPLCSALLKIIKISALLHSCPSLDNCPNHKERVVQPTADLYLFYPTGSCPAPLGNLPSPWTVVQTWTNLTPPGLLLRLTWTFVSLHPDSCHPPGYLIFPLKLDIGLLHNTSLLFMIPS